MGITSIAAPVESFRSVQVSKRKMDDPLAESNAIAMALSF